MTSKNSTSKVVNFDIGGGTTNASVFWDGRAIDSFALDIGGRLIQLDITGKITYVSDKIKPLIKSLKLNLALGVIPDFQTLNLLTNSFAQMFLQLNGEPDLDVEVEKLLSIIDGLSSHAIDANIKDIYPIIVDGINAKGYKLGTPIFVKYGRIATMDKIN